MTNYNTKGTKHRRQRKDLDRLYNRGFVWNPHFDNITNEMFSKSKRIQYSRHLRSYEQTGNREFDFHDVTIENLAKGQVVEIETEFNDYNGEDIETIRKAVVRLPQRSDGEQIVAVVAFDYNNDVFIKTAWLNKANDNHSTGLDTSEMEVSTSNRKYGYFYGNNRSKAWEILDESESKTLDDNVMITMEEWNRRNGYGN